MVVSLLAFLAAVAQPAAAYHPRFDPSVERPAQAVPNQVMVIGTAHLSNIAEQDYPPSLEPLIARLASFKPQIVTIEAISGLNCHFMRQYPSRWKDSVEAYCWDPAPARAATGLDVPAATAEAARLLRSLGPMPTAAQRRRLAGVLLAAGDRPSALVQWLRLTPTDRIAGDDLTAALVTSLEKWRTSRNEDFAIAAPLAARLGLDRVEPVDDHTADFPSDNDAAYNAAMKRAWDNRVNERRGRDDQALVAGLKRPGGLLALYRNYNDPKLAHIIFDSDFGAALRDNSPQRYGRQYVGYWETRNLRMVANIRDLLAQRPSVRLLAIVGASHKPYYEAYLSQSHDVDLVDPLTVLR